MNMIDGIVRDLKFDKHLDHIISAAKEYLYQEDKRLINFTKNTIAQNRNKYKNYILTKDEQAILKFETDRTLFYRIEIYPKKDWEKGKGLADMFAYGATIRYSTQGPHLARHIVIAHEIGHILMHTKRDSELVRKLLEIDDTMEAQATTFAEKILEKLSSKFKNRIFLDDITVTSDDIRNTINEIKSGLRYIP